MSGPNTGDGRTVEARLSRLENDVARLESRSYMANQRLDKLEEPCPTTTETMPVGAASIPTTRTQTTASDGTAACASVPDAKGTSTDPSEVVRAIEALREARGGKGERLTIPATLVAVDALLALNPAAVVADLQAEVAEQDKIRRAYISRRDALEADLAIESERADTYRSKWQESALRIEEMEGERAELAQRVALLQRDCHKAEKQRDEARAYVDRCESMEDERDQLRSERDAARKERDEERALVDRVRQHRVVVYAGNTTSCAECNAWNAEVDARRAAQPKGQE